MDRCAKLLVLLHVATCSGPARTAERALPCGCRVGVVHASLHGSPTGRDLLWPISTLASPTLANLKCLVLLWPVLLWPILGQQENSKKKKTEKTTLKQKSEKKHEGRRRLHKNTACARLLGFNRPSCGASPAEGRRCST